MSAAQDWVLPHESVAQIFNLLYRRFSTCCATPWCGAPAKSPTTEPNGILPISNRQYAAARTSRNQSLKSKIKSKIKSKKFAQSATFSADTDRLKSCATYRLGKAALPRTAALGALAFFLSSLVSWAAAVAAEAPEATALAGIDFRYAPPWWQTAICLPDDPDKALVGKEGQLLFDFGGGGVRNFGLCLRPEVLGETRWLRQETLSARAPIVRTWLDADGVEVLEETFIVTPGAGVTEAAPRMARIDGDARLNRWAKPAQPCAPEFTSAEVAYGGKSIQLRVTVPTGSKMTAVFGFCEGWHKDTGQRPLILQAEGAGPRSIDPVKDFGLNHPGLYRLSAQDTNRDGIIELGIGTPADAKDRNAILNAVWLFDRPPPPDGQIISGEATRAAYASWPMVPPARRAVVLMTLTNTTASTVTRQPALRIQTPTAADCKLGQHDAQVGNGTRITASAQIVSCVPGANSNCLLQLAPVVLPPGGARQIAFTVDRHNPRAPAAASVVQARHLREAARRWWERGVLPFDTVQVPDAGIQGMLESCVRNIWQARELRNGQPAFHVGPTVYRGLWVVDGSFLLETAALLGRGKEARAGVEYLLSHQNPDGSFDLLGQYWKENGIVLWAATRHAMLTQDKAWLRTHWASLQRVIKAIENLRAQASKDPSAPYYRLLPPGTIDGGIAGSNNPEYSNMYWTLAGLRAAIAAAHWLGDEQSASDWQHEFDDFYAVWRRAAERDIQKDSFGNTYVPTLMGNLHNHVPARGQWAFCHAVYPGQVFPSKDPLVESQLGMLRATKVEGMVFDTGWMRQGIWTYFASFYGHALLWEEHPREAADVLYAFAQHAAPTRVWREEQKPVGKGSQEVGDMPHNWASAEFIRLTTHLIELDRGADLHLLEGFPREWAGPGMVTRLNGVLTPFGPLYLEVRVSSDGREARVRMAELTGSKPAHILLHLAGLKDRPQVIELPVTESVEQSF